MTTLGPKEQAVRADSGSERNIREDSNLKDLELAACCCDGDEEAARDLVARLGPKLRAMLVRRGTSPTLAQDLVADLWADCFAVAPGGASLLSKYAGRSSLNTWLTAVLTHRWLDHVRRNGRLRTMDGEPSGDGQPAPETRTAEPQLTRLLHESLRRAFERCDPETFVLLQLVYFHGISQRVLARLWGVSEFKISRRLSRAMRRIQEDTLAHLRAKEPWLQLEWEDFVDVCSAADIIGSLNVAESTPQQLVQERRRPSSV